MMTRDERIAAAIGAAMGLYAGADFPYEMNAWWAFGVFAWLLLTLSVYNRIRGWIARKIGFGTARKEGV